MGYFLRRTGFFLATLWAAITLNFLIPRLQPGDPAEAMVSRLTGKSEAVDPTQVEAIRKLLGAPEGNLLTQYWDYLGAAGPRELRDLLHLLPVHRHRRDQRTPRPGRSSWSASPRSCRSSSAPCSARGRRTGATPARTP